MNPALRKIAEEAVQDIYSAIALEQYPLDRIILAAIHQAIRVVLEEEPSGKMLDAACQWREHLDTEAPTMQDQYAAFYRAMTAQKLKELEDKT